MASMRRTPAEMLLSETILKTPMSPVRVTCVPPQSSLLKSGMETTRTWSPYFSPNKRHGAGRDCLIDRHDVRRDLRIAEDLLVDEALDLGFLGRIDRRVVGEIETKTRRLDDAACLFDVRPENRDGARRGGGASRCGCAWSTSARVRRLRRAVRRRYEWVPACGLYGL